MHTTAIIADDEPHMREMLREQLQVLWPELDIVGEADSGPAALVMIDAHAPHFAFLDIRMPGMTGLQVAQAKTAATHVVFVTAFDAHAIEAFEVSAIDYLLKPVEMARLARVVARLKAVAPAAVAPAAAGGRLQWLQVAVGQQVRMVQVDEVRYFESDLKYTRVVAGDVDGIIRASLKQLGDQLDPDLFVRAHRGTIVNRRFIRAVHRLEDVMEIELKDSGERLRVSQPNYHLFRAM